MGPAGLKTHFEPWTKSFVADIYWLACEFMLVLAPLTACISNYLNLQNAHLDNSSGKYEAAVSTYLICISF